MLISELFFLVYSGTWEMPFEGAAGLVAPRTLGEGKFRIHAGWEAMKADGAIQSTESDSQLESGSRIESFPFGFGWGVGTWTDFALTGAYHRESGIPIRESSQAGFGDTWLHLHHQFPIDGLSGPISLSVQGRVGIPTGERGQGVWARDRFQQPVGAAVDSNGSTGFGGAGWGWGGGTSLGVDFHGWRFPISMVGEFGFDASSAEKRDPELNAGLVLMTDARGHFLANGGIRWNAPLHRGDSSSDARLRAFAGAGFRFAKGAWLKAGIWGALGDRGSRSTSWKKSPSTDAVALKVAQDAAAGWWLGLSVDFEARDPDSDGDGVPDRLDRCPEVAEDLDGFEDRNGCSDPDDDLDGVCDSWVSSSGQAAKWNAVCHGADLCPRTPEDIDGFHDQDGCPDADNDHDGICDPWVSKTGESTAWNSICKGVDRCAESAEDFDGNQDLNGCPDPDNDGDGISDSLDACPDVGILDSLGIDAKGCPIPRRAMPDSVKTLPPSQVETSRTWRVFFDLELDTGRAGSRALIDSIAMQLFQRDTLVASIEGNSDSKGEAEENQDLSERRGKWLANLLVAKGIGPDRIHAVGRGISNPLELNDTEEGRARNRRCDIVLHRRSK
jgi:outer membrane protein OmpA-like peptidoglycan-associated protein